MERREETVICSHCGRSFENESDHFVSKCVIQHEIRSSISVMKNCLKIIEKVVDEKCSHCSPRDLEEEKTCQNQE